MKTQKTILPLICAMLFIPWGCIQAQQVRELSQKVRDSLAIELTQIFALDQGLRNLYSNKSVCDQHEGLRGHVANVILVVDSLNLVKMMDIISTYGYPSEELLGDHYQNTYVKMAEKVVFLHAPFSLFKEDIYPVLRQEAREGRLDPETLASYLDKYYVTFHRKTLYDSVFKNMIKVKGVCREDKALSDSLRLDIGLPVLADSLFIDCTVTDK